MDKKQELISLKFSVSPDENERQVKQIYDNWKQQKVHKEKVYSAILEYEERHIYTRDELLNALVYLVDELKDVIRKFDSVQLVSGMPSQDNQTSDFDDNFRDTMLGAW